MVALILPVQVYFLEMCESAAEYLFLSFVAPNFLELFDVVKIWLLPVVDSCQLEWLHTVAKGWFQLLTRGGPWKG